MPLNSNQIKYIIGDTEIVRNMEHIPAFQPFDDQVIDYWDTVSKILLNSTESKQYPDVITFAFWCRKASIKSLQKPYEDNINRIGRGVAFHIAPSNVAVNFAYSLAVGMFSGNANIVRLPSKEFEQVRIICEALLKALDDNIKQYICLVQYGHNQDITDCLSAICDTRIIWGGDQTIATIRKSPLKPRATEITFADRYSICVIDADEYLKAINRKSIAQGFFNDTYLTDQNACTSPRLVVWMGDNIKEAQDVFWNELHSLVKVKYLLHPLQVISKYSNLFKQAATNKSVHLNRGEDNYIVRIKVDELTDSLMEYKGNSGYFMEYEAKSFDELLPLCTSQCQTLSYYGLDANKIHDFVMTSRPRGIDRIISIGKTMDFSLVWDGYDLIRSMSRELIINKTVERAGI